MNISSHEAAQALGDIALTQHRASILRGYERGAPHFLLWGLIWVLGYSLSDVLPGRAGECWLVLDAIGIAGSYLIGRATPCDESVARRFQGVRFTALALTLCAFILATYYLMKPNDAAQYGAFPALLMASIYTSVGIWRGIRWSVAGVVLGVLTIMGLMLFKAHFMLWMAAAGGTTLLLTGYWLRRA